MKRIGLIALALVLSLGLLGVGLAQWTDELTLNGSVETGNIDVEFTDVSCSGNDGGANVATCTISDQPAKSFTVNLDNGYPCYQCTVNYVVNNTKSSIPVKINSIKINGVEYNPLAPPEIDLGIDGVTDIEVTVTGIAVGDQIEANDGNPDGGLDEKVGDLEIHVCSDDDEGHNASMNASGSFIVTIDLIQWNYGP